MTRGGRWPGKMTEEDTSETQTLELRQENGSADHVQSHITHSERLTRCSHLNEAVYKEKDGCKIVNSCLQRK
jgi:hypothetical protein